MSMDLLLWISGYSQLFTCLFIFFRDKTGKFPDYPDDDEGGSAAIFKEKDPLEVTLNFYKYYYSWNLI